MKTKKSDYKLLILFPILYWSATSALSVAQPMEFNELFDWESEPAAESLCQGHYIPQAEEVAFSNDFWQYPILLSADSSTFTLQHVSTLKGNVTLKQKDRFLRADEVTIERDQDSNEWKKISAFGHIHYVAPGISIFGKKAVYDHQDGLFQVDAAYYRWYARHARGYAQHIKIDKEANVHLHDANYTTCAPLKDTWMLKAKEISLYPKKGRAIARHIRLDLHGFPVLYFPYFNYPIDKKRHSGFLFPSYGSTSNSGFEFTIPYYWNIAPNFDFTLGERWLTERGLESQTKFRYLFANSEGVVQWHFLPNDRKYGQFQQQNLQSPPGGLSTLDPRIIALETSNNRHALNYHHTSTWSRRWQFNIIFDYVSDDNYFVDLGNDINTASTIHLPQQANLYYYGEHWTHYFNVEEYQVLQPLSKPINEEIYKRQPQWVFQAFYPNQFLGFSFGLIGETVNYAHLPQLISQTPVTTGQRYHLRPSVNFPFQESWFHLTPRLQLDWLQYSLSLGDEAKQANFPENPDRLIPLFDIDSSLFFERILQYRKYSMTQTIEPRLYYLYVPYHDQRRYPDFDSGIINFSYDQLFRDNRFSGRDRIGDANQLSVSVMSRFLQQQTGQEWLRASVGQIFYFQKHRVILCEGLLANNTCPFFEEAANSAHHSDLVAQIDLHASRTWSSSLYWQWDSSHQDTEQAAFSIQYQLHHNKIVNLYYYWLKHDLGQINNATRTTGSLNQADLSFLWPVTLHWEILSLWRYNFQQRQTVEVLGGVEYNGCCVALQLVGSRYRQSNNYFYPNATANGIFAQVVLKGLSAIGLNNPDGRLKQKIPGYIPLSDRQKWLTLPHKPYFPPEEIPLY